MIDSEIHWKKREQAFFRQWIGHWNDSDQVKIIGLSVYDTHRLLVDQYDFPLGREGFMEEINRIADEIYEKKAQLLDGALELIKKTSRIMPLGLTSSATKKWVEEILNRFELQPFFSAVVSADDIDGPSKPDPAIYRETARRLKLPPEKCVVIEDATHGITAAKDAGMRVVGLRNGFNSHQDLSRADWIIEGLKNADIKQWMGDQSA